MKHFLSGMCHGAFLTSGNMVSFHDVRVTFILLCSEEWRKQLKRSVSYVHSFRGFLMHHDSRSIEGGSLPLVKKSVSIQNQRLEHSLQRLTSREWFPQLSPTSVHTGQTAGEKPFNTQLIWPIPDSECDICTIPTPFFFCPAFVFFCFHHESMLITWKPPSWYYDIKT